MHIRTFLLLCCCFNSTYTCARFSPSATILLTDSSDQPLSITNVISQPNGSGFIVKCHGSSNIIWTSSNGVLIPNNQSGTLYQIFDHIGEQISLVFTSFSPNEVAVYTCESPLNDVNNVPVTESIFVTNCELCMHACMVSLKKQIVHHNPEKWVENMCNSGNSLAGLQQHLGWNYLQP